METIKQIDLDKDREASAARLKELKAGRDNGDIPVNDPYWDALKKHRRAHMRGDFDNG